MWWLLFNFIFQLSKFRRLLDSEGHQLTHNYRPVQPLNGRLIYENQPKDESNKEGDDNNKIDDYNRKEHKNDNDDIDNEIKNKFNKDKQNSSSKLILNQFLLGIIFLTSILLQKI